jgi:AcrR family transcriptional regulator
VDLWERVDDPAQPARLALSSTRIALAGIEIGDVEGLDGVSMRKVASRLGAGTMSLYRYVRSRDELISLMIDQVYAGLPAASRSGDWRVDLAKAAHRIRKATLNHPWLAGRSVPRLGLGPNLLRTLESTLALVDGYGMTVDEMLDVLATVQAFVQGYVLDEISEQAASRVTKLTKSEVQQQHEAGIRRIVASGRYPLFVRVVLESEDNPDPDMAFERRLGLVLDGLAPAFR